MKEKYVVSLYAAEMDQNELRAGENIMDGIYDVLEAVEARNSFPEANRTVIGLRIHKKGTRASADINVDILIGDVIHLEPLEYLAELSGIEQAADYIAELISIYPDLAIHGSVTDDLRKRIQKYATSHKNAEEELRNRLLERLSELEHNAMAYAGSPDPAEQKYAQDLLWYCAEQSRLVMAGQKHIDLARLPVREAYLQHSAAPKTEKDPAAVTAARHRYKNNSLLGKLYEYQELIRQMKAT